MEEVFLSLGGNIGDVLATFAKALDLIAELPHCSHLRVSKFYRTSPVSDIEQPDYTNCVCHFQCGLTHRELFMRLQEIEKRLGRQRIEKEAPRLIDIDIVLYGQKEIQEEDLVIPHPRWFDRLFVLVPLLELTSKVRVKSEEFAIKARVEELRKMSSDRVLKIE